MSPIIILLHGERAIDPQVVCSLYAGEGWWPERTEEEIARVLEKTLAVGAWDGEQLIGFARAISDHHFHAYIDDVIIHPAYQGEGIGKLLMSHLIEAISRSRRSRYFANLNWFPSTSVMGFEHFRRRW